MEHVKHSASVHEWALTVCDGFSRADSLGRHKHLQWGETKRKRTEKHYAAAVVEAVVFFVHPFEH